MFLPPRNLRRHSISEQKPTAVLMLRENNTAASLCIECNTVIYDFELVKNILKSIEQVKGKKYCPRKIENNNDRPESRSIERRERPVTSARPLYMP
ncbi:hypothetical protein EVAR_93887_1 [Eumeta japonica]|uniref:Uncharacterized protein n=1 Tax=Eumeta variegata TaxID=151549 RepID=A0A4C1TWS7_EUMVA|nr:hypothetical protein EVAR_93887_1 [Eumeta japonica]